MASFLDLMICIFPFEKSLYEASGLRTEFVGHPMVEELERHRIKINHEMPKLVALLPGSRNREIKRIFPVMLEAAKLLAPEKIQPFVSRPPLLPNSPAISCGNWLAKRALAKFLLA